jgi:hypothetical protein
MSDSNLDDILDALGVSKSRDPIADAIASVAHSKLREQQRAAAARLAEREHAARLAELRERADAEPGSLTLKELGELDRADREAARAEQEAAKRDYDDRRSRAHRRGKETADERYADAWADWLAGNGRGHGVPAPRMEDFTDE